MVQDCSWLVSPCHTCHNYSWPFPQASILQVKWIAVNIEMRSSEIKAKTAADEHRILCTQLKNLL